MSYGGYGSYGGGYGAPPPGPGGGGYGAPPPQQGGYGAPPPGAFGGGMRGPPPGADPAAWYVYYECLAESLPHVGFR